MKTLDIIQVIWIATAALAVIKWLTKHDIKTLLGENEANSNKFQVLDLAIVMIVYIMASSISGVMLKDDKSLLKITALTALSNFITISILLPFLNVRLAAGIKSLLPAKTEIIRQIKIAIAYSFCAYGIAAMIMAVTVWVCSQFGYEKVQQHDLLKLLQENGGNKLTLTVLFLSAAVTTPISEEIIFRGFFLNVLAKYTHSKWLGIAFSSVVFAFMHSNPQHMPALFFLGGFFGYSMFRHNSILIPVIMHMTFNAINITGTLLGSN